MIFLNEMIDKINSHKLFNLILFKILSIYLKINEKIFKYDYE